MNNFKNEEKVKLCTFYHNYRLSTKNFDGNLLYELFLSNSHIKKTQIQFPKPQIKLESKLEGRRTIRTGYKSECKKYSKATQANEKSNRIQEMMSKVHEKVRQSTEFSNYKYSAEYLSLDGSNKVGSPLLKLHHSIEARRGDGGLKQSYLLCNNGQFNNRLRRPPSRRKQKQKLQLHQFFRPESIVADPWIEGKLGGFSAQYISVLSNNKRVYQFEGDVIRQIASLTKIMTCMTAIYLCQKYQLDINTQQIKVTKKATLLEGTTAGLVTGDILKLNDIFYAMMLPSGNDAAQTISDFFDKIIIQKDTTSKHKTDQSTEYPFIYEMNKLAECLKMKNTHFDNPHGLSNKNNYSTANDMVELCHYAMKNNKFRQIVKCQEYETKIFSSRLKLSRNAKWVNTNKLLSLDHCEGIKTGVTPTAGPCMAASFQRDNFNVIIVILNAKNKTKRFQEVKNLYDWAEKQINTNNA